MPIELRGSECVVQPEELSLVRVPAVREVGGIFERHDVSVEGVGRRQGQLSGDGRLSVMGAPDSRTNPCSSSAAAARS